MAKSDTFLDEFHRHVFFFSEEFSKNFIEILSDFADKTKSIKFRNMFYVFRKNGGLVCCIWRPVHLHLDAKTGKQPAPHTFGFRQVQNYITCEKL